MRLDQARSRQTASARALAALLERRARIIPDRELFRPTMVFAPHPDDETLACGGTILRLTDAAVPVWLVVMTAGQHSHPELISSATLAAQRQREMRASAAALGLAPNALHWLGFEDGRLAASPAAVRDRVAELIDRHQPAQVLVPYWGEPPADHVAASRSVSAALDQLSLDPIVREYPIWLWDHWPWTRPWEAGLRSRLRRLVAGPQRFARLLRDFRERVDLGPPNPARAPAVPILERKWRALACHATQMTRWRPGCDWPTLADVADGRWLACFFGGSEYFHTRRPGHQTARTS